MHYNSVCYNVFAACSGTVLFLMAISIGFVLSPKGLVTFCHVPMQNHERSCPQVNAMSYFNNDYLSGKRTGIHIHIYV